MGPVPLNKHTGDDDEKNTLVLFVLLAFGTISAEGIKAGIILGSSWAYAIAAPAGYLWDNESLASYGITGLFYPEHQKKYEGSKHNMYINPVEKREGYPTTLSELVSWDISFFTERNPSLHISHHGEIRMEGDNIIPVYAFTDSERGFYMLHAYTIEEKASFMFVMIARSTKERTECEAAFHELVQSFRYLNQQPNIRQ